MKYNELDQRCKNLLKNLLNSNSYIQVQTIADDHEISKRSVYYDLYKINEFLDQNNIDNIAVERSKGLYLQDKQKQQISKVINDTASPIQTLFSPQTRLKIIICSIINHQEAKQ